MKMLQRVFAYVMARTVTDHQKFRGGNAASAFSGEQDLRVDGGESHRQLLANGVLTFQRKRIRDARDGGRNIHGVQR